MLAAGEAVARLIAFGTTIYLARTLGASAYGIIGFAAGITLYLTRIADSGIEYFGLGIREIAEDPRRLPTLVPGITIVRIAVALGLLGVLAIVASVAPRPETAVLALYGLTLVTLAANTRWVLLGLEKAAPVAVSRIVGEGIFAAFVLITIRSSADLLNAPLAQFAGDAAAALLVAGVVWRSGANVRMELHFAAVRPVFARSWRLVLSALLGLVIYNSDLILLRFFRDTASVGYYAASYTFISFLLNLGATYNQSLLPALTRGTSGNPADSSLYQAALAHTFALSVPVAIGGFLLAAGLVDVTFGKAYAPAAIALSILVWSLPLSLMREVATAGLMSRKGESSVLRFTLWSAVANLTLNLILIRPFGIVGAALATVATEAIRFTAALFLARGLGYTPLALRRLAKPAVSALLMGAVVSIVGNHVLAGLVAGVFSYLAALTVLGGISWRRGSLPDLKL